MIVVQCEFDGVIAEEDVGAAVLGMFCPAFEDAAPAPGGEERRLAALYAQVGADRDEIVDFVMGVVVVRYDFDQFVNYCRGESVRLVIVSAGLDLYVRPTLELLGFDDLESHTAITKFTGNGVSVRYVNPDGAPAADGYKRSYVERFRERGHTVVYVGAAADDLDAARQADFAIARGALADAMAEAGLPHETFDTFGDVARAIIEIGKLPSHIKGRQG